MNFRDSLFFVATQNTHDKAIFVWDLYKKRQGKVQVEAKNPDTPDGIINFKSENVDILAFAWQQNSCCLYSLIHSGAKEETVFCSTNIGLIERKFTGSHERDDPKGRSPSNDKFAVQVSFSKPDKTSTFERLPVGIQAFHMEDRLRSSLFGMNQTIQVMIDMRDKSNIKRFGKPVDFTGHFHQPEHGPFHIAFNGSNEVIFAKTDGALLFDIRKVRSVGRKTSEGSLLQGTHPQSGV
jgi:hypothetical protein